MKKTIIVKPERCIGCAACIKACPASEANKMKIFEDGRKYTSVKQSRCISCGHCITACKRDARDYTDDIDVVMSKIYSEKMIVIIDPAIKTAYPARWKWILDWFKSRECMVYDASFGADIYVWAFMNIIEAHKINNMISSVCPSVVNYIKSYRPGLIKNLAPLYSPLVCAAIYIKNYEKMNRKIVAVTPCIAKKSELADANAVDYSITFKKLMDYFSQNSIYIANDYNESYDYQYDGTPGNFGSLFSRPGGLKDNLLRFDPELSVEYSSGSRIYEELDCYDKNVARRIFPEVFDVLSCEYGCNLGIGSGSQQTAFDAMSYMRNLEADLKARLKGGRGRLRSLESKQFEQYEHELELDDFLRVYTPAKTLVKPAESEIEEIFKKMGKNTPAEKRHDCGMCGYDSCTDFACSVFQGLSPIDGCVAKSNKIEISEVAKECRDVSSKLTKDMESIAGRIRKVADISVGVSERAAEINELLNNIIKFCDQSARIEEEGIKQLIKILQTISKVMTALENSISRSDTETAIVNNAVSDVNVLISKLNKVLDKVV